MTADWIPACAGMTGATHLAPATNTTGDNMARERRYWLMKSEPGVYGIEHLARDKSAGWSGVRNYQARNFMRDDMKQGDGVFFYHSNAEPAAIAGIAKVTRESHPDPTQFDTSDVHYDPKATKDKPVWMMVEIGFVAKFARPIALDELRKTKGLEGMALLKRGQRLSIMPVTAAEWAIVCRMAGVHA